ncbi:hypothetical protein PDUR_24790 [Paenibacillus durus]|uniref:Iron ABC transporter permease n=1 Tax=Paenibacillus durus TaxID=44251 RepID=A0A089J0L5_PAEDU|nr:hypothetical protein PDUR_24790 [Paenibacillus durus]
MGFKGEATRGRLQKALSNPSRLLAILGVFLLLTALVSLLVGRYSISFADLLALAAGRGGAGAAAQVLFEVRLTRIGAAILTGAALSMSGTAYQGMLRNPLVSPDILGAAAGASGGAALAILLGLGGFAVQTVAFCTGLGAVLLTFAVSRAVAGMAGSGPMLLLLTGMVVGALFAAGISIIKFVADPYNTLPAITFWLMGGLSYVTGTDLLVQLLPMTIGAVPMLLLGWRLNVLSFGDEEASALGVDVRRLRLTFIVGATLLTSTAVSAAGMIGWVGLIIPHLTRMIAGVNHRLLLPASALIGAGFLLIADDLARGLFDQEIPLGILTSIVGAPVFLYLFMKEKN